MSEAYSNPNFEKTTRPRLESGEDIVKFVAENERYQDYLDPAADLRADLESLVDNVKKDGSADSFYLELKPTVKEFEGYESLAGMSREEDLKYRQEAVPFRIYGEVPEGSKLLIELAYAVTGAKDVHLLRDKDTDSGHHIMLGSYKDQDVYFVEECGHDELGEYKAWMVMNVSPDDLIAEYQVVEPKPFIPTGERHRTWDVMLDDVSEWPTVGEPRAIKNWIRNQRKLRQS